MHNNLADGKFQILYPSGDTYCGKHKGGIRNGEGTYVYTASGIKYEGGWKDDQKDGKGEMIFPLVKGNYDSVARLSGDFKEDELLTGDYIDSVGNVFASKKFDERETSRIQTFIEKHFCHKQLKLEAGHFENGRLHGWGEVDYKGGDFYRGMFKDGKRSGYGLMSINQYNNVLSQYQ